MDLGISGKRALVMGASRGLGRAIAEGLLAEGVTVCGVARTAEAITAWAGDQARLTPIAADLASLASVDALADRLLAEGGVDILINNSGGPPPGAAATVTRGDWLAQFEAMAANLFHLTGRLLPPMRANRWGRIITIASSGVEQPIANLALSNGIRSAVVGWSKTLAAEVAGDGVTVNIVLPGRIQTTRVDELDAAAAGRTGSTLEAVRAASAAAIPAGRYGRPEEFASMVVYLASQQASYVTGGKLRVDGGAIRAI
ncbi:MAG: SDR family oxidoreductase [Tabrizicola sp.]|uniref:SDR family oxidoreductase n=1 Tax=Tabrizicola sp. TaxID=2005166 RepID=UPI0027338E6E|nr:SDR family oxidoreductase [Tabrizicola sp.]MDP3265045.1 SDR family oxidoreductase [Tabrizicola sp.]MDP3647412.1 SDR family oxidoreductase [Paracoccaceae bacterium]MDZ4066402.1 SDR family oxidoreductase [Tabrizicola sp.]